MRLPSGDVDPNFVVLLGDRHGWRRRSGVAPDTIFIPLSHYKMTVVSHQNRCGKAVPDYVRDRRGAWPTA